jgi:hypothetical protein
LVRKRVVGMSFGGSPIKFSGGVTHKNLQEAQLENKTLRRSLDGARANVKRQRERNVTILFPDPVVVSTPR